jgi:SAM-dependent methyltransferase
VVERVRAVVPSPVSVLDAGCGTGRHAAELVAGGFEVVGVDLSPSMLEVARERLGDGVALSLGDLRTLDVRRTFDAVICLNGTIGYLIGDADLEAGLAGLVRHVAPGGVLLLEPWCSAEQWLAPQVSAESCKEGDVAVTRVSRAFVDADGLGAFDWHCAVATPERSWSFVEHHRLALRPVSAYVDGLARLGFDAPHDPTFPGRGLGIIVASARAGG